MQPDVVVVELCQYRVSMLKMDEKTLLKEAKDINLEKVQQAIKQVRLAADCFDSNSEMASSHAFSLSVCHVLLWQNGVMSGLMQILLLKVSAHITEQLGMAPGGEFREAFKEVSTVFTPLHTNAKF